MLSSACETSRKHICDNVISSSNKTFLAGFLFIMRVFRIPSKSVEAVDEKNF